MKTNMGNLEYSILVNGIEKGQFNDWENLKKFVIKIKTRPISVGSESMLIMIKNNMTKKACIADRFRTLEQIKKEID